MEDRACIKCLNSKGPGIMFGLIALTGILFSNWFLNWHLEKFFGSNIYYLFGLYYIGQFAAIGILSVAVVKMMIIYCDPKKPRQFNESIYYKSPDILCMVLICSVVIMLLCFLIGLNLEKDWNYWIPLADGKWTVVKEKKLDETVTEKHSVRQSTNFFDQYSQESKYELIFKNGTIKEIQKSESYYEKAIRVEPIINTKYGVLSHDRHLKWFVENDMRDRVTEILADDNLLYAGYIKTEIFGESIRSLECDELQGFYDLTAKITPDFKYDGESNEEKKDRTLENIDMAKPNCNIKTWLDLQFEKSIDGAKELKAERAEKEEKGLSFHE